jgi:hypothetical protein
MFICIHTGNTGGEQNTRNSKKLRNRICVRYIERTSVGNNECSSFTFTLCSARVSPLMTVLNDSPCERIDKWKACPILKGQIVGARIAGESVANCHIIGCIESDSF